MYKTYVVILILLATFSSVGPYSYQSKLGYTSAALAKSDRLNKQISTLKSQIESSRIQIQYMKTGSNNDENGLKFSLGLIESKVLQFQEILDDLEAATPSQATQIQQLIDQVKALLSEIQALWMHFQEMLALRLTRPTIIVNVVGKQFFWSFSCSSPCDGSKPGELHVPHNTKIVLNITSADVFHSIGIPALGLKADAIKGVYTALSFSPPVGTYQILCLEFCGSGHSMMRTNLTVE